MPNRFRSRIRVFRDTCGLCKLINPQAFRLLRYRWSESQVVRFSPQLRDLINRLKLCVQSSPSQLARLSVASNTLMLVLVHHAK